MTENAPPKTCGWKKVEPLEELRFTYGIGTWHDTPFGDIEMSISVAGGFMYASVKGRGRYMLSAEDSLGLLWHTLLKEDEK